MFGILKKSWKPRRPTCVHRGTPSSTEADCYPHVFWQGIQAQRIPHQRRVNLFQTQRLPEKHAALDIFLWKNARVGSRGCALRRWASPAPMAQLTVRALVRKREVPLWRFLRQDYGARTKPTLEALFCNANHYVPKRFDFHHIWDSHLLVLFQNCCRCAKLLQSSSADQSRESGNTLQGQFVFNLIPHDQCKPW